MASILSRPQCVKGSRFSTLKCASIDLTQSCPRLCSIPKFLVCWTTQFRFPNHMTSYAVFIHRRDNGDSCVNSLRPIPNRRYFADDIFKRIFENENEWISSRISLKFVPDVRINNIPALVQIMAWRRPGDKPLYEPMMVSFLTHTCVTRPQWVNQTWNFSCRWKLLLSDMPLMYRRPKRQCAWNLTVRHICTGRLDMEGTHSCGIHAQVMCCTASSWFLIGKNNFYGRHSNHLLKLSHWIVQLAGMNISNILNWRYICCGVIKCLYALYWHALMKKQVH